MFLEEFESKLKEIDPLVYYGAAWKHKDELPLDYIVFNRVNIKHNANKTSKGVYFAVHIIRENYVPEDMEDEVINKVTEIDGVRLADTDTVFTYDKKPNTNEVVEIMTITFVRARKVNV